MAVETDLSVNGSKGAKGVQACDYFVFCFPPPEARSWEKGKGYKEVCIYIDR